MIVTDNNVHDALAYLSEYPSPLAKAKWELRKRQAVTRRLYAQAFLNATGSVEQRKCVAQLDTAHAAAEDSDIEAEFEVDGHKDRSEAAENIIEVWRSENANARAAERIR